MRIKISEVMIGVPLLLFLLVFGFTPLIMALIVGGWCSVVVTGVYLYIGVAIYCHERGY